MPQIKPEHQCNDLETKCLFYDKQADRFVDIIFCKKHNYLKYWCGT